MVLPSFLTVLLSSLTSLTSFGGSTFYNPNAVIGEPRAQSPAEDISSLVAYHLALIKGNLTQETYEASQPSDEQRAAWRKVIGDLLEVPKGRVRCSDIRKNIPDELKGIYTVAVVDRGRFCALVERDTIGEGDDKQFGKGWGLFVVPAQRDIKTSKSLHLSAPHPVWELSTAQQAAFVFEWTGAESLYIPGRAYKALLKETDCGFSTESEKYWKTDPVHDKGEMMFTTYEAILGKNDLSSAYVQFRGKAKNTCRTDQIFVSAGIGRDPLSEFWYNDPSHDQLPFHQLFAQLVQKFSDVTSPSSSRCSLTATENIIGRLINGVPEDAVCFATPYPPAIDGSFINLSQNAAVREEKQWDPLVDAFLAAFGKA